MALWATGARRWSCEYWKNGRLSFEWIKPPEQENRLRLPKTCSSLGMERQRERSASLNRKEVIQPHLPVRLPCYDFTPLTRHTFGTVPLTVRQATSGTPNSGGVTGGVYKARERIHRAMLMRDY